LIRLESLEKRFGSLVAVDRLDLHLEAGRIHALLGPNGAGKTTTVRMLSTLTHPTSGRACVAGFDVSENPMGVRRCLGVVQQTLNFDPELTVIEALQIHGRLHGLRGPHLATRVTEMLAFAGLETECRRIVPTLSGGMRRRLSIARALLHEPKVILMDEPTVGLDAHARRRVWDLVRTLRDGGCTVVITTHYMEEAQSLSDRVVILDKGRAIANGSPETLIAKVGIIALDQNGPDGTTTRFFDTRDAAAAAAIGLETPTTLRTTTLEDVFIQLTGRCANE
jgi:ABC-2 type transport system ATP-binding protein